MNIVLAFVHSGYAVGGFAPTLTHFEKYGKYLQGNEGSLRGTQEEFGATEFECGKSVNNSFFMVDSGNDGGKKMSVHNANSFQNLNE